MTHEEKKAIELLYGCVIHEKYYIFQKTLRKAIEVVLTLVNKQNKTIEYWIKGFERELDKNRKNVIEIIEKDNKIEELEKAVDKKDKIIEAMSDTIETSQYANIDNTDLSEICCYLKCKKECDDVKKECIKEYFEKKEG